MSILVVEFLISLRRSMVAALLAVLTTVSLFFIMLRLISSEASPPVPVTTLAVIDVFMEDNRAVDERTEFPKKPIEQAPPPEIKTSEPKLVPDLSLTVPIEHVPIKAEVAKINTIAANYPVPHLLSAPTYPARALLRGTEGWVELRFNLSAQGTTQDIVILDAEPEGVFERAALAAVKRWKYQPLLDYEGQPKTFVGLTKRVIFEIQD